MKFQGTKYTPHSEYAKRVLAIEAAAIKQLIDQVDEQFDAAIELILSLKGRLVVTGIGKSGWIGRKLAATFSSTGTPSFFLHPAEAFHGDLGMVNKEDALLALSKSGETSEILQLIPYFKRYGIPNIAVSATRNATLAQNAECFLE